MNILTASVITLTALYLSDLASALTAPGHPRTSR